MDACMHMCMSVVHLQRTYRQEEGGVTEHQDVVPGGVDAGDLFFKRENGWVRWMTRGGEGAAW